MLLLAVLFWCTVSCADREHTHIHQSHAQHSAPEIKLGAQQLISHSVEELRDRSIGLLANPASRIGSAHLLDTLLTHEIPVTALFAAEHGFRGDVPAGEEIQDGTDLATGLPVFSLYGQTRRPTSDMLAGIDLLLFDLQDAGVRFYTYISTLGLVLEAAAEHDVEVWVLDRPNPLGGTYVSGWVLEPDLTSFVGAFPIPIVHGMTIGELARMMVGEGWLTTESEPRLRVIPMENWTRDQNWDDTGLNWVPPSPNLPHFTNALVYPGTCFFEGSTMSEGRGTFDPFMKIGSPGLVFPDESRQRLQQSYPALLEPVVFTPVDIPGMATNPKHRGTEVSGIRLSPLTLQADSLRPLELGLEIFREMLRYAPNAETNRFLYNLAGTRQIDSFLESDAAPETFWEEELEVFMKAREPYLLY
ncbi:exo-beta-N-acetylmuramidase NamZ family protein [Cyclonatronum proteinivorum]|uniref:exo-beta-N-acetylmuramidase NamZ family protein n=1 Tax=Cyclonatronum proteinivorum TaxID=1457365 RepID=UPI0013DFE084|nr:DUF1343 domain-containing protein [Cyclonatronum proteinivorum]